MELDNLKEMWSKEQISETPEISLEKQKEIHLPLEKIRQNMRMEFWSSVVVITVCLSVSWFADISFKLKLYITMLVFSMMLVSVFYYLRFFKLYKEIGNPMLKTYESLKDLLHQFDLNKQYYISFCVSFIPFYVAEIMIIQEFTPSLRLQSDINMAITFIFLMFLGLISFYFFGKFWFKLYYGKHIKRIENTLDDLK